jgi:hypothetical protein
MAASAIAQEADASGGNVMVRLLTAAVLFSLFTAPAVGQSADGLLITQRVTSPGDPLTIRMQIDATRMRTEVAGPNGATQVVIFDGGKQVLYTVDPARQTYTEMTKADADRMNALVQEGMAQMQAQLEKLPAAQRAQMEAMMKGRGGAAAAPQYTRTGSDTVGRWTCDKYDLMQDGQKIGEACTVNPTTLGFGATDFDVMRQMSEFFSAMAPQMASQLPAVSPIDLRGSSGFPVKTVVIVEGRTVTTEVIEVGRQTFADSLFAVPAGFTKQDIMGAMGGRGTGAVR